MKKLKVSVWCNSSPMKMTECMMIPCRNECMKMAKCPVLNLVKNLWAMTRMNKVITETRWYV